MLRIGLIGCGRIAQGAHLVVLTQLRDIEVTALADPDPLRRQAAQRLAPAAQCFADGAELLDKSTLDAVVIASSPESHAELAANALRRSLHIYLEKPIATTLEDAAIILDAWKRTSVVAMVGLNYRYHALYLEARRLLNEGTVGNPVAATSVFTSSAAVRDTWRSIRSAGGGALLELATHHVDMTHFLLGQTSVEVKAQISSTIGDGASATLAMQLANGVLVNSFFSFGTVDEDRLEIYGDEGLLRVNRHSSTRCHVISIRNQRTRLRQIQASLDFLSRPRALLEKRRAVFHEPSYAEAIGAFLRAIRTGEPGYPDLSDGFRALSVIVAAEESAKSGSSARVLATGNAL